jgi:UDP:flavonoid glycosyltransferase YjiC (YdhE family)
MTGAGIFCKNPSAKHLRTAVDTLLTDSSYREHSRRIGASFRAAGGFSRAADEIAALLGK